MTLVFALVLLTHVPIDLLLWKCSFLLTLLLSDHLTSSTVLCVCVFTTICQPTCNTVSCGMHTSQQTCTVQFCTQICHYTQPVQLDGFKWLANSPENGTNSRRVKKTKKTTITTRPKRKIQTRRGLFKLNNPVFL